MGQKKNKKILFITILLLIILILLIGITYAYLATDTFKSKKELFFKYMTQLGEEQNGFIETSLKEYVKKKQNTPNINEGTVTFNDFTISFSGQMEPATNSFEQEIHLNYSEEVDFPIHYRQMGNTIGLQTQYVGNKYIAVETDKLEEQTYSGLENVRELVSRTKKLEELKNLPFSQEELQQLGQKYSNIIHAQLQETQFSKIEEEGKKGYQLSVTAGQLKNIVEQLLQMLKNDQPTLDKINNYLKGQKNSAKLTTNTIENAIKKIEQNSEINDGIYEITVFEQKGKVVKLIVNWQETQIILEKKKEENSLQYEITWNTKKEEKHEKVSFKAQYIGLQELQNVKENYELELEPSKSKNNYQYQYNNQTNFVETINIEGFTNDNAMLLNNYEEEAVNNFLEQVRQRIEMVNSQQMEQLGLEENENPLLQMINPITQILRTNQVISVINNTNVDEIEVNDFNQKFQNYESTNLKGATVKGLLTTIQSHNEAQENSDKTIKEIHFDAEEYEVTDQNIAYLKSSIETQTSYRVEFEKDEDTGMIYRAVINKK